MNQSWTDTINLIKSELTKAHLWYSDEEGWLYVTDVKGVRHRFDSTMKQWEVKAEIDRIKNRIAVMR